MGGSRMATVAPPPPIVGFVSPGRSRVDATRLPPPVLPPSGNQPAAPPSILITLEESDLVKLVRVQALVRRFLCLLRYRRRREKSDKHRVHVARELLETERQYVRSLDAVTQSYFQPLLFNCKVCSSSAATEKPILELDKVQALFGNIAEIRTFNTSFLAELATRCEQLDTQARLGDLFLKWGPFFKIYITYCNNHERAAHMYLALREEPRFGAWLENTRTLTQVDPLDSYLIRPVQRIPRYLLLLQDMLKCTPAEHADHADLKNGVAQMQVLADLINSAIKQAEKLNQVLQIQERLGVHDLVEPWRVFVRTGVMQLCALDNSSMFKKDVANYWFYLFNDLLVWAERQGDTYRFRGRASLHGTRLKDISDITVLQNAFHLITPDRVCLLDCISDMYIALEQSQLLQTQQSYDCTDTALSTDADGVGADQEGEGGLARANPGLHLAPQAAAPEPARRPQRPAARCAVSVGEHHLQRDAKGQGGQELHHLRHRDQTLQRHHRAHRAPLQ